MSYPPAAALLPFLSTHANAFASKLAIAGLAWGVLGIAALPSLYAQRDLTDIPIPDPGSESAAMRVDESANVNLYAADPQIRKPIQMNFDASGALWVATSEVYPQIKPGEEADDKIVVLRDTDGDGDIDQSTTFADGLLIPTGVIPDGENACYVADSTQLLYLEDTDSDGIADKRRVIFSGFGTEDTHHLLHTLRWGPDGCLYFNQSIYIHSHIDTAYGTRHLDGGGIWRYRPSTGRLEIFCKGFINPWGHVFDEQGESFVTDGAGFEGINYAFPDSVFNTSPGARRWVSGLNPGSPKHCGLAVLSGTHIPPDWRGNLVTNDFRSHRVCRFDVTPEGSGFRSQQQPEIITTSHVAFRPIDVRMGPDGAVYVADWYNPIIQHGEVDFRDERRDRKHGRIWRVSFPKQPLDHWPEFSKQSTAQLCQLLDDPSLDVRQFAREELWRRAATDSAGVMKTIRDWRDADNANAAMRALEVLWMNEVVSAANLEDAQIAIAASKQSEKRVLGTTLRSIWRSRENVATDSDAYRAISQMVYEQADATDPRTRLEVAVSVGQARADRDALNAVIDVAKHPIDSNLDFAIWQSLRNLDAASPSTSILEQIDWQSKHHELAIAVRAIANPKAAQVAIEMLRRENANAASSDELFLAAVQAGNANQLGQLLELLTRPSSSAHSPSRMTALLERTKSDGTVPTNANSSVAAAVADAEALTRNPAWRTSLYRAVATWKLSEAESTLIEMLPKTSGDSRAALIEAIGSFESDVAKQTIRELLDSQDTQSRVAATRTMATHRPRAAFAAVLKLVQNKETIEEGSAIIAEMAKRKDIPEAFASVLEKQTLDTDLASHLLRYIRSSGGNARLEEAIRVSGKLEDLAWKLTPELSAEILSQAKKGSPANGERIYRQAKLQCINCHAIGTAGGLVGPNLISIGGSSQPDYILESLLTPNVKLKEGYTTTQFLTDEGRVISGIVLTKNDKTIQVRLADGTVTSVLVDSIEDESPGKSLMPEGLLDNVTQAELADLVAFLSALGRVPEFTVSTDPMLRSVETLIYSNQSNHLINRTSTDAVASGDAVMQWRPLTSRVDGTFTIEEMDAFKQHRTTPPTSFIRFRIKVLADTDANLDLPSEITEAWVDGKPFPATSLRTEALEKGEHTIVLAIDRTLQTAPFTIGLAANVTTPEQ
ncbi:PVC-type heme-binding CxxCH protein [Novipirellula sp. SH528]|uniref:PVC-type heme-binding CxxCH protein n=1 Tax=Novipirellula sp. SH528 TaxID=3454466 RepID=UPI003F9FB466